MAGENSRFFVCDVRFNEQFIEDVHLAKTCPVTKIVQGLWDDAKFRNAAVNFLKNKEQEMDEIVRPANKCSLKSFHNLDRSILRAYVAIRIMPTWKWLELKDFVADFENRKESLTVADVLGNFNGGVHKPILRIVPKRETEADDHEVKTIVQELLQTKSLATLSAAGCPLSKGMLSLIGQDKYTCTISYEKREKFIHWLKRQDFTQEIPPTPEKTECSPSQPITPFKIAKSRVTFDPEDELKKLVSWFDANQRPGKELIERYTEELNNGRLGKCKRMLTPESIAVWFKNRRAKTRKEEGCFPEPWERGEAPSRATMAMKDNNANLMTTGVNSNNHNIPSITMSAVGEELHNGNLVKANAPEHHDSNNLISERTGRNNFENAPLKSTTNTKARNSNETAGTTMLIEPKHEPITMPIMENEVYTRIRASGRTGTSINNQGASHLPVTSETEEKNGSKVEGNSEINRDRYNRSINMQHTEARKSGEMISSNKIFEPEMKRSQGDETRGSIIGSENSVNCADTSASICKQNQDAGKEIAQQVVESGEKLIGDQCLENIKESPDKKTSSGQTGTQQTISQEMGTTKKLETCNDQDNGNVDQMTDKRTVNQCAEGMSCWRKSTNHTHMMKRTKGDNVDHNGLPPEFADGHAQSWKRQCIEVEDIQR